jgi:hypothetical protein
MEAQVLLKDIIKDTIIINQALEAKKIDIALSVLKRRSERITLFKSLEDKTDEALWILLEHFRVENDNCILNFKKLRTHFEEELMELKRKKQDVHFANKVNHKYKLAEAFLVGNRFDSNKI